MYEFNDKYEYIWSFEMFEKKNLFDLFWIKYDNVGEFGL